MLTLISTIVHAQNNSVTWACLVLDNQLNIQNTHIVTNNGGKVNTPVFANCKQNAITYYKNTSGDVREQVSITCDISLGDKISIITSCYFMKTDENVSRINIKSSLYNFDISLGCKHP